MRDRTDQLGGTRSRAYSNFTASTASGEDKTKRLKATLEQLEKDIEGLGRLQQGYLTAANIEEEQKIEDRMTDVSAAIQRRVNRVRSSLKEIARSNQQLTGMEQRSEVNKHKGLTQQFLAFITKYSTQEQRYEDKLKMKLQRQYKIINPNATQAELSSLGDRRGGANLFALQLGQDQNARYALQDAKAQHEEIIQLEKNILELAQIFEQMSELVNRQGELVDNIELHVDESREQATRANKELKTAVVSARKSRKRKWWLIGCCTILFIVLMIIITIYVILPLVKKTKQETQSLSN